MATDSHGFELDEQGVIIAYPLTGYSVARVEGIFCLIKLEYALTDEDMLEGRMQSVQLVMTAAQLREMSHVLLRNAGHLEGVPPPKSRQ